LDTGSDISLFKISKLKNTYELNQSFTYDLTGIGEGTISTLGSVEAALLINNQEISHTFHIVDENFPIPVDGIIGYDFIKRYSCKLDYNYIGPSWLVIPPNFSNSRLKIEILDSPKPNALSLPARSEVVRKIFLDATKGEPECLVPNQEIANGIFVGNTIVTKSNAFVKIVNTTNQNILLENFQIQTESLHNYHIVSTNLTSDTAERRDLILSKIAENCPLRAREKLIKLCSQFTDVFAIESDKVTYNNFYKQKLRLKDNSPVYIKNYRTPHQNKPEIDAQIKKMIEDDIIEPSVSEYNSPILLVPKKSLPGQPNQKRWRLVVDYRQVNKKLLSDKYPLPRIDDILDQLGRAKTFSCLDLISGFHQIELEKNSRDITSFSSTNGSFRFKRLPYGLKIAPNSFQRMMALAFSGLGPDKAFVYMDDLIVIGCSDNHMLSNLKLIFEICRKTNLKLHPDKCTFFNNEVNFLGHKCTDKGILPDEAKFEKIKSYPRPATADEARRFVAFMNYYRRFIKDFAHHAIHITRLTRKNTPFIWTENCEKAFNYLRDALLSPKILKYPDFDKQFCITTDASKLACGAVLSQDYNGIQLPIAFASRSFTKGESNKSVIEQELAAIHWGINFFKPYVYGTKFLVKSDHKPLTYLFSMKNASPKLTRMRLDLEEFDFEIEYIRGKDNCGADALSRIDFGQIKQIRDSSAEIFEIVTRSKSKQQSPIITQKVHNPQTLKVYETITVQEVKKLPKIEFNKKMSSINIYKGKIKSMEINIRDLIVHEKLALEQFFSRLNTKVGNAGYKNLQISLNSHIFNYTSVENFKEKGNINLKDVSIAITPKIQVIHSRKEQLKLLRKYHEDPILGGHTGVTRLLSKLRRQFFWKNITKDARQFVKNCELCKKNKPGPKFKEPMQITNTPKFAFQRVQIDTIGPLPKSAMGNEYAITIVCELTKFLVAAPIPDKSAKSVAKAIVDNFILLFGPIKEILTDLGTEYKNQVMSELCQLLKITHHTSTPYHHQTLGTVERNHRTFNEYLRSYLSQDKTDWDEWLKYFVYCYNTTPSSVHGYTPFELVFGKTAPVFEFLATNKVDPLYNYDAFEKELKFRLQTAQKRAAEFVTTSKNHSKHYYDKTAISQKIQINDMVYIRDESRHKLDNVFVGPYKVLEVDNMGNCKLDLKTKKTIIHKNRLKLA